MWDTAHDALIRKFLHLQKHCNFLDVGCGSGLWTSTLYRLAPSCRIMGIDTDLKALRTAKKRFDGKNVDLVVGGAHSLPLKQRSFDLVTCRRLLMNLRRRRVVLSEMKRVAKRGGVVAAVEPSFRDASEFSTIPAILTFNRKLAKLTSGKKAARADLAFGPKVMGLFVSSGLKQIDARVYSLVQVIAPPYKKRDFAHNLQDSVKRLSQVAELSPRINDLLMERAKKLDRERARQVRKGKFAGISAVPFFIVKGTVP